MARILITVWPFPGHVNPLLAVAHALRARGHDVAFYTGRDARPVIEDEDFRCFPFDKLDEERIGALLKAEQSHFASLWDQIRRVRQLKARLKEWLLGTVPGQLEDLEAVRKQFPPNLIVCETALWGPILVLHEIGRVPVAVFSTMAACLLAGPDAPAWGRGLPRPRNWRMRLRSRMERQLVRCLSADFRAAVDRLRAPYGLPPLDVSVTEFAGRLPLYLVPSTPEFDYERRDLPSSVRYVGPCLWDKPRDEPPPAWLADLPRDQPLVHVTEATIHVQEPILLRAAAVAFRDRPVQVVMTTGKHRDPAALDLGPLSPNIRVERYVPHSDVLPRSAAVVSMGGAGTLLAALRQGVPLVVVPTEWDKPENAQRVVEAGAGLRLEPKRCTPERLRAAVDRVLEEPSFRRNAQRLATAFARYGGPAQAAELLEGLAAPDSIPRRTSVPSWARGARHGECSL